MAHPVQYVMEFPLPPRECSPNYHGHWRYRQKAVRAYVGKCCLLAIEYRRKLAPNGPPDPPAQLHLDCFLAPVPGQYRPRDDDNAIGWCKGLRDSLVRSEWLPGDTSKHLRVGRVNLRTTKKQHQGLSCVVVTLEYGGGES